MKITICGSTSFIDKMKEVKNELAGMGHEALIPESAEMNQGKEYWNQMKKRSLKEFSNEKGKRMIGHFEKIKSSDAILVLNYDKNGVNGYIGPNTLIEMAVAFENKKKIFVMNDIQDNENFIEEIISMKPSLLDGNLREISD